MSKQTERYLLFGFDSLSINFAFITYYWLRVESGLIAIIIEPEFLFPMFAIYAYWLVWFGVFGLYRSWYFLSRLDEVVTLFRTTSVGVLVLFFLIFLDDEATDAAATSRLLIAAYWGLLFLFVTSGRLFLRSFQKRMLEQGIGLRHTLIVGFTKKAQELCDMVMKYPALGYTVVGFVSAGGTRAPKSSYRNIPVVGSVKDLPVLLEKKRVNEVLVGLDSTEHDKLLEIMKYCDGRPVGMKIIPDLYDIVSGQARMSSIYGFPLIEVTPQLMKPWEESAKRFVDVLVSLVILLVGLPLWLLIALLIKMDSAGPVFYRQERVGRNGKVFTMLKFRSMVKDAEQLSGPKWAERNDPRVTRVGWLIRRLHLDEVPQFINVLVGDMSLVGPRPERPYFVAKLSRKLPLYRRRLKVRPGITGWAQIKHTYDQSVEDVKMKVKYDLFYIENMSWRFDLKILFNTLYVMVRGRGHT
jgi:exopolysaccharide biosynthesis polyprenyl glycosylphosphotransferase